MAAIEGIPRDLAKIARELETTMDVIQRLSTLEGELQQQLAKSETRARDQVATDLANVIRSRDTLVKHRRELLEEIKPEMLRKLPGTS